MRPLTRLVNLKAGEAILGKISTAHGKSEDHYLFNHYKSRLERFDKLAKQTQNAQVEEILETLANKKATLMQSNDTFHLKKLIRELDHNTLNSLLYNGISSAIKLPKPVQVHIEDSLNFQLTRNRITSSNCDHWFYSTNLMYQAALNTSLYDTLINQLSKSNDLLLSDGQFFHLLFLLVIRRNQHGVLSDNRTKIIRLLDRCSFIETATISSAYFKTKTRIKDYHIIEKIVHSTLKNRKQINFKEPGFCSVVKSIRYSRQYECRMLVMSMIRSLFQEVDSKDILVSSFNKVHVLKLMEVYRIYDENLLNKMAQMMFSNLGNFRIKDIQYILSTLSNFAYMMDNMRENLDKLVADIISEKRRDADMQYYHLMPILRSFAILNYYNDDLIAYINKKMENNSMIVANMREVLEFDRSALLFYVACRLEGNKIHFSPDSSLLSEISSKIDRSSGNVGSLKSSSSLQHLNFLIQPKQDYLEMTNSVRDIGIGLRNSKHLSDGPYSFYFQYTLPHQNYADLVITNTEEEVGSFDKNSYMPKFVPKDKRYILMMAVQKFDYVDGEKRLSGYKQLLMRLLRKLGYHVMTVEVDNYDTNSLASTIKSILDDTSH